MQSITDFWKTATGKIAILGGGGVVGLLSLCFTCAVCGTIFGDSSDKPIESTRNIVSFSTEEPTPLPTLEPSPTPQQPTATPMSIADAPEQIPTPEPTNEPAEKRAPIVTAGENDVNMRSGPGTEYDVVSTLEAGQSLEIVGRNADSSWWQVSTSDGLCWVADSVSTASNVDDSIPVIEAPPAPIPTEPPSTVESTTEPLPTEPSTSGGGTGSTPFECIGGCATPPDPSCAIKGNVNSKGEKIYHVPGGSFYDRTDIKPEEGDRWFCTAEEARNAGFRASER